jgi:DNA polymerase
MPEQGQDTAAKFLPAKRTLETLKQAARRCTACDLYLRGTTQTVFGEGESTARLVLVGEQPGDAEDKAGHPFVGPSGKLLDRALAEAGIDRADAYAASASPLTGGSSSSRHSLRM